MIRGTFHTWNLSSDRTEKSGPNEAGVKTPLGDPYAFYKLYCMYAMPGNCLLVTQMKLSAQQQRTEV